MRFTTMLDKKETLYEDLGFPQSIVHRASELWNKKCLLARFV